MVEHRSPKPPGARPPNRPWHGLAAENRHFSPIGQALDVRELGTFELAVYPLLSRGYYTDRRVDRFKDGGAERNDRHLIVT